MAFCVEKKNKPSDTVTVHRRVNIRPEQIVLTHSEPPFEGGVRGNGTEDNFSSQIIISQIPM